MKPASALAGRVQFPLMAVRVDLENRTVVCSVHDLLADPLRRSLGIPGEGLSRLTVGAELHRTVQAQRQAIDPTYTPEVGVDAVIEVDGWRLRVIGRVDGAGKDPGGLPFVEEIKTLHFRTELYQALGHERLERFRWQVKIYSYLLYPHGEAIARLLLVDLGGSDRRLEQVPWSPQEVLSYVRGRLQALVGAERRRERLRAAWRAAASELPFPFDAPRPIQLDAMEAVAGSLAAGRHLLLSAPTGVGKTAAALFPTVRRALETGGRAVFLTAKTLQQGLAVETLQRMQRGEWRSIQLRAKAKMCANREMICHEEFCVFAKDYGGKLLERGVVPTLLAAAPHLDPDRTLEVSRLAEVCPFEVSLELLHESTAVVCDYNYVFDPSIGLLGSSDPAQLQDTYLIIDEAHNLVERAREYYSPRLSRNAVRRARRLLEGFQQRKACRDLDEVLEELETHISDTVVAALGDRAGTDQITLEREPLAELRLALDGLISPYFVFKRNADLWLADDPVVEVLLQLARLVDLLEDGGKELVTLAERGAEGDADEFLRIFCLDASRFTRPLLDRCAGCIAMSATLEPFDFYRELLGFDPARTDTVSLPSPFPPENRLVLAVDEVDTSFRRRAAAYGRVAELVAEFAPPGRNAMVLFPSYAFLREVAERLVAPGHRVEVQRGEDSDRLRQDILARLRSSDEPVLLLAVLGGVFAEGVDYPGEMLSEVVVVSPALPQVGPERELLKRYFEERYERGFEYAYLVPGMTRVIQAAGRLIRSEDDRGAIVLICQRFLREPYLSLLPHDWTDGRPQSLRYADPVTAVHEFLSKVD